MDKVELKYNAQRSAPLDAFRETSGHIYRALFLKSFTLQWRQKKTNIIQLIFVALLMVVLGLLSLLGKSIDDDFPPYTPSPQTKNFKMSSPSYSICNYTTGEYCSYYHYLYYADATGSVGTLPNNSMGTGLLGNIHQDLYKNYYSSNAKTYSVPYFHDKYGTAIDMDKAMIEAMAAFDTETSGSYYSSAYSYLSVSIPTAAINVHSLESTPTSSSIDYTLQTPKNYDNYVIYSANSLSYQIDKIQYYTTMMTNALVKSVTGVDNFISSNSTSFWYTPYYTPFHFADLVSLIALFFIPSALFFSLPIIVFAVVYEKQEKLTEMMKMMGVSMNYYWSSQYVYSYIVYVVMTSFIVIIGVAFGLHTFTKVNPLTYIFLFLIYGTTHVAMSFFISCFFNKARGATIFSYFFSLLVAAASSVVMLFVKDSVTLSWLQLFPPFAVQRGIYIITYSTTGGHPLNLVSLSHASPLLGVYLYLFLETLVLLTLTWYLDKVLPREHGVNYPVLFPLYSIKWLKDKLVQRQANEMEIEQTVSLLPKQDAVEVEVHDDIHESEDPDCAAIRRKVHSSASASDADSDLFVKIVDLHKRYPAKDGHAAKDALNQFCLALNKGECLGLLGPNGAGKTTLISILCGMSKPTSGYALIDNMNIRTEMYRVHKVLGLCPQHDILWADLSVEEHLLFYSRLKGYDKHAERAHVNEIATMIGLGGPHLKKLTTELSGGMKRRLSIAISLVGSSELVLMDEPTTGLDPETRRSVWDVINANKVGRSIIITTHNMEEADVLCGQIAIMSRGRLRCYGSPLYLKNKFGAGYKLSLSIKNDSLESVNTYIRAIFPSAKVDHTMGTTEYIIPVEEMSIGKLFSAMKRDPHPAIIEWGVNQMSLEEVFLKMIEQDEK
jgi:ABC-type multidrug transport system ATPase subunit